MIASSPLSRPYAYKAEINTESTVMYGCITFSGAAIFTATAYLPNLVTVAGTTTATTDAPSSQKIPASRSMGIVSITTSSPISSINTPAASTGQTLIGSITNPTSSVAAAPTQSTKASSGLGTASEVGSIVGAIVGAIAVGVAIYYGSKGVRMLRNRS